MSSMRRLGCGHSYGGMVITELADHPSVAHTVYLSAFWPQRGQSVSDMLGGGPLLSWIVPHDNGTLAVTDDLGGRPSGSLRRP
jgi:pimeloyl-ACP methyl ester carboxylesterase